MKSRIAFLLLCVLSVISCKKNRENSPAPVNPHIKYQQLLDKFIKAGAVGADITVISGDDIWRGTAGMADRAAGTPMNADYRMRVGSISKLFTSVTVLKLQEAGLLNIKDKITKYLPPAITGRIANADKATLEDCLNQRSGIREYMQDAIGGIVNGTIRNYSAEQSLALIYDKPADAAPGSGFYSNSNYLLLSLIIKKVTGRPAYEVVTDKVIRPLGLSNTFASTTLPPRLTHAYYAENNSTPEDVSIIDYTAVGGEGALDGGIISTSADIARFVKTIFTGNLLTPASLQQLQTYVDIDATQLPEDLQYYKQYGLGLMKLETDQGIALGHDGHVHGFICKAYYLPSKNVTVAILLNTWNPGAVKILDAKATFNELF